MVPCHGRAGAAAGGGAGSCAVLLRLPGAGGRAAALPVVGPKVPQCALWLQMTELAPLALMPACLLRKKVLRPMATMAGGTMLAAALAVERGWAVNLGGGMHHAAHGRGGGWCAYADLTLALRRLRAASGGLVSRFMIVDLDVHQASLKAWLC